ncbi:MAG: DUF4430 domain-containing protein [Thermoleophilia bacterium]|nr:DUF4430 domain-containing protein [Thermoleophilia bacterium]
MRRHALAVLALAFALSGCGGPAGAGEGGDRPDGAAAEPSGDATAAVAPESAGDERQASLWITRDRGEKLILTRDVPPGLTVLQALDRVAEIETRYGGRFVQSIEGIGGSLSAQRDWFFFVNGIEPDVGAAEIVLGPGDVAWWDFRSWDETMREPVVVGAFPEPFLHGFDGRRRPWAVKAPAGIDTAALEAVLGPPGGDGKPSRFVVEVRDGATGALLTATRGDANDAPVEFLLEGSGPAVQAALDALAADPAIVRYRYTARFDGRGNVVG